MVFNSTEELIHDIRLGKMVVLLDDEDRENEGDLVMAADCVQAEDINFMATNARGLICLTLSEQRCKQLNLPLMVDANGGQYGTNFTVSIEAAEGVTTGISAADRARTVQVAVARGAQPADIVQPGHIFPIMAQPGGVLNRAGHTEAGCDLSRLAGFEPAAVIVEIMNDDGTMARRSDLESFAAKHNLKIGTIADLIHYRMLNERTVELLLRDKLNTDHGEFMLSVYRDSLSSSLHLALSLGDITAEKETLVRVQAPITLRDVVGAQISGKPNWNVRRSLEKIAEEGQGVVVILAWEESSEDILAGIDIALGNKPKPKTEAVKNVAVTVGIGSQILRDLGVGKLRLMGEPVKYNALSGFDLELIGFVGVE